MKQPFQAIAEITKIETMAKGLKIVLQTNELNPADAGTVMSYIEEQGWFLFKPAQKDFSQEEIDNLPDIKLDTGEKSPGQRLRGVIYRLWERSKAKQEGQDSELFYRRYMDKMIEGIKEKLN